ncbi:hypothetical protein HDV00_009154 [Rhizophlyctis rosea]|nr:hypothetical protein HDV00_009154 [Rhizophlyctis rosea]
MVKRPILLILDLNGTLIERITDSAKKKIARSHPAFPPRPDFMVNSKPCFCRPYLDTFFAHIFADFHVGAWTSATPKNAGPMIDTIFGQYASQLKFKWDRTKCSDLGNKSNDFSSVKDLRLIWADIGPEGANKDGLYSAENTILLDDTSTKASHTPDNGLHLPTFTFIESDFDAENDESLLNVIKYLDDLRQSGLPDVRVYLAENALFRKDNDGNALQQPEPRYAVAADDPLKSELPKHNRRQFGPSLEELLPSGFASRSYNDNQQSRNPYGQHQYQQPHWDSNYHNEWPRNQNGYNQTYGGANDWRNGPPTPSRPRPQFPPQPYVSTQRHFPPHRPYGHPSQYQLPLQPQVVPHGQFAGPSQSPFPPPFTPQPQFAPQFPFPSQRPLAPEAPHTSQWQMPPQPHAGPETLPEPDFVPFARPYRPQGQPPYWGAQDRLKGPNQQGKGGPVAAKTTPHVAGGASTKRNGNPRAPDSLDWRSRPQQQSGTQSANTQDRQQNSAGLAGGRSMPSQGASDQWTRPHGSSHASAPQNPIREQTAEERAAVAQKEREAYQKLTREEKRKIKRDMKKAGVFPGSWEVLATTVGEGNLLPFIEKAKSVLAQRERDAFEALAANTEWKEVEAQERDGDGEAEDGNVADGEGDAEWVEEREGSPTGDGDGWFIDNGGQQNGKSNSAVTVHERQTTGGSSSAAKSAGVTIVVKERGMPPRVVQTVDEEPDDGTVDAVEHETLEDMIFGPPPPPEVDDSGEVGETIDGWYVGGKLLDPEDPRAAFRGYIGDPRPPLSTAE